MRTILFIIAAAIVSPLLGSCGSVPAKSAARQHVRLVVGTYTGRGSEGIYLYDFDTVSGGSRVLDSVAARNPSFLAYGAGPGGSGSMGGGFVYAVREDNRDSDTAVAFALDAAGGSLSFEGEELTQGRGPCHITVDGFGRGKGGGVGGHVVTANYMGGSISVFGLNGDGTLAGLQQLIAFEGDASGVVARRQEASHLHCTVFSPDGKYLFATDLGADRIYRFDVRRTRRAAAEPFLAEETRKDYILPPGSGPRHMVFDPAGRMLYVVTELSGDVLAYRYAKGELEHVQTIQADPVRAGGSADIVITPDGRFLYSSNRNRNDGVAIFRVGDDGLLSAAGYQRTGANPRNIAVSPEGRFLLVASGNKNRVEVYAIDPLTGALTDTGKGFAVSSPVCLVFVE